MVINNNSLEIGRTTMDASIEILANHDKLIEIIKKLEERKKPLQHQLRNIEKLLERLNSIVAVITPERHNLCALKDWEDLYNDL